MRGVAVEEEEAGPAALALVGEEVVDDVLRVGGEERLRHRAALCQADAVAVGEPCDLALCQLRQILGRRRPRVDDERRQDGAVAARAKSVGDVERLPVADRELAKPPPAGHDLGVPDDAGPALRRVLGLLIEVQEAVRRPLPVAPPRKRRHPRARRVLPERVELLRHSVHKAEPLVTHLVGRFVGAEHVDVGRLELAQRLGPVDELSHALELDGVLAGADPEVDGFLQQRMHARLGHRKAAQREEQYAALDRVQVLRRERE
mmetsp:Transcript_22803/g.67184  ORF Transcript_22803/g.67184 Transcript_22803/m.67184 type:complete len:261 (-) Transcript_22803:267-1049(-)